MNTEKRDKTVVVSCRVPEKLAEVIKRYCQADMHLNPADFVRDAIREKLKRDAPELCEQLKSAYHGGSRKLCSLLLEEAGSDE
jgi:Arc/MetJ-type ribon-helix-helix transcriptional regulator